MIKILDSLIESWTLSHPRPFDAEGNWISVHTELNRSSVILTTIIGGKETAWITYDAEQLDELIRILLSHRDDLR